ncbi:hypothetical protein SAMN05446037_100251 [Anaerovirgula multivorans]|uniref:Uncharacterized protein n=1 Tax=Anaerovirgula multivorans TaxID=312168 RepID=A0A239AI03_9FIRM|nr:hypothetical protein [Anaerovirgula multivorans]SNR95170.1 hypothetical protein SAMN05446037_100251 [Anaerovirgula multivorans]
MKKIFKEAHKMTKEMVEKYGVDYQAQFGLNLAYLLETKEEGKEMNAESLLEEAVEIIENNGLSFQVKLWEKDDIRRYYLTSNGSELGYVGTKAGEKSCFIKVAYRNDIARVKRAKKALLEKF